MIDKSPLESASFPALPPSDGPATPPSVPGTPSVREPHSTLVDEIKATADKLAADGATRGDLKILSRVLRELRYAFKVFTPYRRQFKVTVFGSARTSRDNPAYLQSVEFGRRMAAAQWMVVTGAGGGIMEGAHVGAGQKMSMGVNIMLPFEQESNAVISQDQKLVHLKYFFTRKLLFVKEVHAVALFPGGFGTQDEGFETLTLVQTGKRDPMPIVLLDEPGGTYWTAWQQFVENELLGRELVSPEDLSLYKVTDNVETAVNAAQALEILRGDDPVDLLFSDVIMPGGMNGVQLAVEARRIRPELKVLLTSGYTATALSREHGLPDNLNVVEKPYQREELAKKLRLVIGG